MNECVNLENVGRVEELLAMTEQMQDELDQKDQTILELNRQLNRSLTLNEKLNSENRAENIEALRTKLKQTEEQLTSETDSRKRADAEVVAWKFKYEKAEQAKRYAQTHQKTVEVPVEKKVPYEKCDNCDRTAYQKAKEKCDNRKIQLEKKYKQMTTGYESLMFLLAWYSIATTLFTAILAAKKSEQREILLGALTEISDGDPLLKYYVDTTTHEIILSFLGKVQMEVICAILEEKYHVEAEIKEPTVIYMERPLRKAEYTIHIEVPPNPFWASVGLSIEPLPIGSGVQYESRVSLGYLNQSFQNAVMEGVLYGCGQGLYGWKVTDCKICFEYGLYYSPVSTPADFRLLSPIVLEQALKKAGTELLEPYLHFETYAPQEYLSRAYHDAPRYCADIVSTQIKNDEVILKGEIPARCIQEYRNDLTYFTNGQGVCLTELKGYQPATGKLICQPRRPNSRIDKVRHMFHKLAYHRTNPY